MSQLNKVVIMGNLTRDPEVKKINGTPVATLRLANNRSSGSKKEVCYVSVIAWDKQALACQEYLKKGSTVVVEGRLTSRQWAGPDGFKRNIIEVVASLINFMGRKDEIPAGISNYDPNVIEDDEEETLEEVSL
jgi:single-strand DNA-binding protein